MAENITMSEENNTMNEEESIEEQFHSGASWFYWIAGLSIVNSIIILVGSDWSFVVGLGFTQLLDSILVEIVRSSNIIAFIIEALVASIFILFGFFAKKGNSWAFIVGMVLYALDGLLFILVEDWLSIGFHAFALYNIYNGFKAKKALEQL